MKRMLLSAVPGGVVIFVLAGFFFGFLLADFFARSVPAEFAGVYRENPNFALIAVNDLIYALMMSFLLSSMSGEKTFRRGAIVGAVVGFAVSLHFDLIYHATTYLNTPPAIAVNVAVSTVMSALGAGVIAALQGRWERSADAKVDAPAV